MPIEESPDEPSNPALYAVTLDNCEREPIHVPGAIQPHGGLLAFEIATGSVLHATANLGTWLPVGSLPAVGRSITDLLGEAASAAVTDALSGRSGVIVRHSVVTLPARPNEGQPLALDAVLHVHRGVGFVEVEPVQATTRRDDWPQRFEDTIDALRSAADLDDLVERMAHRVKRLTGFDRVMVYRFDSAYNGHVIADARESDMESFLDLHYPASDIPAQARELFRSNLVRYIADVHYVPVPVDPWLDKINNEPLDMSHSTLRSVSPVHVQYLKNMGVSSTLTIALLSDNALWGLIACHHRSPTALPPRLRRMCYSLSITASYMVSAHENAFSAAQRVSSSRAAATIIEAFNQPHQDFADILEVCAAPLLKLVTATGGALWTRGAVHPFGRWVEGRRGESVVESVQKALQTGAGRVILTDRAEIDPPLADDERRTVCGVAAISLDPFASSGIVWIRPEYRLEVAWGGNPDKSLDVSFDDNGQAIVGPRTSFARWIRVVQGRSRPWTGPDRDSIETLSPLEQVLAVRESLNRVTMSSRQFQSLVTLQSDAYWQTDLKGNLVVLSKALGLAIDRIHDHTLPGLFAKYCEAGQIAPLTAALSRSAAFRDVHLVGFYEGGGDIFEFVLNGEPIRDADRRVCGMHGTISDITSARLKEDELLKARRAAESASAGKTLFLANMSHEIRTPMNAIVGLSDILLATKLTRQQKEYAARIRSASVALLELLNEILDYSKIEAGRLELERTSFRLPDLLERSRAIFLIQAESKGLTLEYVVNPRVPEVLSGDPLRLLQVINNLVGNALKFTQQGGVVVHVEVLEEGAGALTLKVSVKDTGIGIAPEQVARLFRAFHQADASTSRRYGGTGLGLSISKRLTELMGGMIGVSSALGAGSTFWFTARLDLPVESSGPAASAINATSPAAAVQSTTSGKPDDIGAIAEGIRGALVLVVDDNATNLLICGEYLSRLGLRVETASSGHEAIEKAMSCRPDAILMDLHMPGLDGFETTKAIRTLEGGSAKGRAVPIIALSASGSDDDLRSTTAFGMNGHMTKPVDLGRLARMLARWIPSRREESPSGPAGTPMASADEGRTTVRADAVPPSTGATRDADRDQALRALGGDADLLARVLGRFVSDFSEAPGSLALMLADGRFEEAKRVVHTIKGLSPTIGAMELHRHAVAFETALEREDVQLLVPFTAELSRVLGVLTQERRRDGAPTSAHADEVVRNDNPLDVAALRFALGQMQELLQRGSSRAREVSRDISRRLAGTEWMPLYAGAARAVEEFDYRSASGLVNAFSGALGKRYA